MSTPVDLEARKRAIEDLASSLALSAGAGSGKTSVLSRRIAELVASGREPARIAAITFTEKAAGELESRVRDALEQRYRASKDEVVGRALERFHEITISTIHGFCRELLASEPLDARWAPGTEIVADDRTGRTAALSAWRAALATEAPRTLELFDVLLAPGSLHAAVDELLANRDLTPAHTHEGLDWAIAARELAAVRSAIESAARKCRNPGDCRALAANEELRARLVDWTSSGVDGAFEALIANGIVGKRTGGKKGDWPGESLAEFKESLGLLDTWRTRQLERAHGVLVRSLSEHVIAPILDARRAGAVATFDDLLFRAAELLRGDAVRARLAARWDALLVDEVQDTDPIQAEVAVLLARAGDAVGAWNETAPRSGHLFAVGDPKQSIYRFRRADVTVWSELRELIAKDGRTDSLAQNFRSVPGVVSWVNHAFATMDGYEPQVASRGPGEIDPVVVLDVTPEDESAVTAAREVDALLRHVVELRARGARVADRETGEMRALEWRDLMVLVPRWANAEEIARELERAGVDAEVEGGAAFFGDPSTQAVLAALRAVLEPGDSESIVAALRLLFGLTLEDLARHVAAGGSWRYTIPEQPAGPAADALAELRAVRELGARSWTTLLEALLERTRAAAVWALLPDGGSRLANLDKLRALLRRLERESRSPSDVITRLGELERAGAEQDLSRLDGDSNAVRVTSIFKAKGLEAPVVALLDMARNEPSPRAVVDREARALHLKIGTHFAPPGWEETREREKAALNEERLRWMYVACTRARDQLVIVDHPKASLVRDHLARGWDPAHDGVQQVAAGASVRVCRADALPEVPRETETFPGRDAAIDALLEAPARRGDPEGEARATEVREATRRAARACAKWKSVSDVVRSGRASSEASGTGIGAAGGTLVHRVMERLDLLAPEGALRDEAGALTRALAEEEGLSAALTERCVEVVLSLVAHPVLEEVRRAPEHWKETPFAYRDGARVIAGTIDLCFPIDETRRAWVVVDWKSDAPAPGHPLRKKYEQQLAHYARALIRTVAPCEEVRTVLVGPFAPLAPASESETALANVAGVVRPSLEALLAAGAPVPAVGADVGEAAVIAELELAWDDAKLGLGLDLAASERAALASAGWHVEDASSEDPASVRAAVSRIAERLGVSLPGEAEGADLEPVESADEEREVTS